MTTKLIYDPANTIYGIDINTSIITPNPKWIAIEGMDDLNLTSVILQVKIHPNGVWHDYQTIDITIPNALIEFGHAPNYAQIVRVGTDDFIVYASK